MLRFPKSDHPLRFPKIFLFISSISYLLHNSIFHFIVACSTVLSNYIVHKIFTFIFSYIRILKIYIIWWQSCTTPQIIQIQACPLSYWLKSLDSTLKSCCLYRRGTHNPLSGPVFCWSGVGGKFPGFLSALHGAASKGTGSCPERTGHGYWTQQKSIVRGQSQVAMCTTLNKFNIVKHNEKSTDLLYC